MDLARSLSSTSILSSTCPLKSSGQRISLKCQKLAKSSPRAARSVRVRSHAAGEETSVLVDSRRDVLRSGAALAASALVAPPAMSAGIPSGFSPQKDPTKNYAFLYPFGWQEIAVSGTDITLKDVIEPLESVSVTIIPTTTESLEELGPVEKVAETLTKQVLSTPSQRPELIKSEARELEGKMYYTFEYTVASKSLGIAGETKNSTIRHNVSTVGISKGKLYLLTATATDRRWKAGMQKKIETIAKSFLVLY